MPYQQYRKLNFAGQVIEDASMEFTVEQTTKGKTKFEATVWNLTSETFTSFTKGKPAQIEAGWVDGPTAPILTGRIKSTNTEQDGRDTKYIINGVSDGFDLLNQGYDNSWSINTPFGDVIRDIADDLGVRADVPDIDATVGIDTGRDKQVGTETDIQGNEQPVTVNVFSTFTTDSTVPIKRELDELIERLAEKTGGQEWEWSLQNRTLSVRAKGEGERSAIVLSYDNSLTNIQKITDSGSPNTDGSKRAEFEMMLEPRLSKGSIVAVEVDGFAGAWKVESLKHVSSTEDGEHITSGKLLPQNNEYTINPDTRSTAQFDGPSDTNAITD